MAPKVTRTLSPCKSGEGLSTMCPMSSTILDMAQVFGLRPSGRVVDVTYDWSLASIVSSEKRTASNFCFRTSIALRSSRAALIVPVDSTYEYKVIFLYTDIHKPRLPQSFCFLDHFIIIGVCFGINYHDLVGFRINVKDFELPSGSPILGMLSRELT
ncbi:hypothetical protein DVH24_011991 [Malus domestica]|uniref:Uncharacterized protein n=1 Tax=Malus domestica TaxID=3750 RepID=A0A498JDR9_MALDO|nr:hypothetical protein DVH24_011991 [Malus domestica]